MLSTYLSNKSHLKEVSDIFKPIIYRITEKKDEIALEHLLNNNTHIAIFDEIDGQLKELVKLLNPTQKLTAEASEKLIEIHLNGCKREEYGVWVYYPWSNRLVHLLDEEEFILVRTNRNMYKITPEERHILSQKKVGIVGLSVGQSVAVTMAMERCCGELRLADFDLLELTNLNRIRTGVQNLGLNKTYSVAREIAEIDPYIKVSCFIDGLTEENMDAFFLDGGKIDLFIEECDGLDMKIVSRFRARELQIPVIMEASDKCMVDVERFDLDPKLPILHNLVEHLDIDRLRSLKTNEEKMPYLLDIIGIETTSTRLKASMLEIEQTITTWPQLASAVTMGGGVMTDIARRVMLNHFTDSGRYFVDVEELICDKASEEPSNKGIIFNQPSPLTIDKMKAIINNNTFINYFSNDIKVNSIKEIVQAASLAPSGGNSQPWKWVYTNNSFYLFHDASRSESLLDYAQHASYIALGASVENFVLKAHELNFEVLIDWLPVKKEYSLIARINLFKNVPEQLISRIEPHSTDDLSAYIPVRLTNRKNNFNKNIIPDSTLKKIQDAAETIDGAKVHFILEEDRIKKLGNILADIEKIRLMDKRGHYDFVNEIRWNEADANNSKDGIDIRTIELTPSEQAGFIVAKKWEVIEKLIQWKGGNAFKKIAIKGVESASSLAIILMPSNTPYDYLKGGRSVQKAWLSTSKLEISFQPMSPSTFLFAKLTDGDIKNFSNETIDKLKVLRTEFTELLNIQPGIGEIFIFRLFKATNPEVKSLRLPIDNILHIE
jgi:molybdopterin/thiamine biosynthesis adenylyltransferase